MFEVIPIARAQFIEHLPDGMIVFDSDARIDAYAPLIHQQVVVTRTMPLGNITQMTDAERAAIGRWFDARGR